MFQASLSSDSKLRALPVEEDPTETKDHSFPKDNLNQELQYNSSAG